MAGHPVLVFDIGGTNVRGAVCDPGSGRPIETAWRATPNCLDHPGWDAERLFAATLDEMAAVGHELAGSVPPAAVVVGWPGPVAPDGTALRSPTILGPSLDQSLPVGAAAAGLWPASEVATLNDLSAAGYAYVGRGCGDFCVVTVGSGIGNKVFVDGRPLVGPGGRGALRLAQRLARACPEAFAGSRLARSGDFDERSLVGAFLAGDAFGRRAVELAAVPLGRALAGLHVGVGTERFVLTGGFATAL